MGPIFPTRFYKLASMSDGFSKHEARRSTSPATTEVEFVIKLKTAKALDLDVPPKNRSALADEAIDSSWPGWPRLCRRALM